MRDLDTPPGLLYGGRVERLDLRTMQTQSLDPSLAYPENDRHTWTLPLVFSPRDPHVLYFSTQRLFRTDDGGNHWTVISPDLTTNDKSHQQSSGGVSTDNLFTFDGCTLYAIAESPRAMPRGGRLV